MGTRVGLPLDSDSMPVHLEPEKLITGRSLSLPKSLLLRTIIKRGYEMLLTVASQLPSKLNPGRSDSAEADSPTDQHSTMT